MNRPTALLRANGFWVCWGLPLVLTLLFIVLGGLYSVTTPIFEASDELWHYPYVKYLADGHGLPVQPGEEGYEWRQEGSQPPLYYALAALATFWIDTGTPDEILQPNPHARTGVPLAPDNKNLVIHHPSEGFPYEGVALAVHLIRLLTVLMGAGAVALTYFIAREVAPGQWPLALGASALVAFNPMFLFISASVDNDTLVVSLSSLGLLLLLRLWRGGASWPLLVGLGLTLGLAALTKLSGLTLFPLVGLALIFVAYRERSWRRLIIGSVVVFGLALVVAGWWYYRNYALYGDTTGLNAMLAVAGERDVVPSPLELLAEAQGLFISYWALFGGSNVLVGSFIYDLIAAFCGLGLLGLAVFAAWPRARQGIGYHLPSLGLLSGQLGLLVLSLYRWTQLTLASLGRLLFPGISAISILILFGVLTLIPKRAAGWVASLLSIAFFVFALVSPFAYILPAYPGPDLLSAEELDQRQHQTYIDFDRKAELIGYDLSAERLYPGDTLKLDLYWRALAPMDRDYSVFVHLFGQDGEPVGQTDSYPGMGSYPTRRWRSGGLLRDSYWVLVSSTASAPSQLWVEAGLYDLDSFESLPAFDRQGREVSPRLARLKLAPLAVTPKQPGHPLNLNLGGKVALLGYDLEPNPVRPGQALVVRLYWRAEVPLERDYTVFLHLLGPVETQARYAQIDAMPRMGNYPTSLWDVGEVVLDEHQLDVDAKAAPGRYRLAVGMYYLETMEHLRFEPTGEESAIIAEVEVAP